MLKEYTIKIKENFIEDWIELFSIENVFWNNKDDVIEHMMWKYKKENNEIEFIEIMENTKKIKTNIY